MRKHETPWGHMQLAETNPHIADEVPWSDTLTDYDDAHFTIYMRLLDAAADAASEDEMAAVILGIDPLSEPDRARKSVQSHLERANWIANTGYKELFAD
ncbi:DNA -binding domain-containing protein [Mariluticola halotolerans]|uniref:DNA -binding domain-containing protein n=1 Tax=Mariluticola halotolerans TaxID=2909283 RepID=UPI0026E23AF7|nr:DUF2285 domain-containing protein [Mariluticola halotolerans]UJQ94127.1 DUF2285 domain-containing protein [Mariluticola halotolerans]